MDVDRVNSVCSVFAHPPAEALRRAGETLHATTRLRAEALQRAGAMTQWTRPTLKTLHPMLRQLSRDVQRALEGSHMASRVCYDSGIPGTESRLTEGGLSHENAAEYA